MDKDSPSNSTLATADPQDNKRPPQHDLEHFRAIVQGSDDAIISKTLDGIVTSWNPGAELIFGYTEQEMLGQSLLKLFPSDRVDEETYILQQVKGGARVEHFETERLHKNGRRIHISVTISPIRDSNGTIIGASKIARDISFEVAAKARLRLTSSVFTGTSEGILITDARGSIVEVNEAFTRITGYAKNEVLARDTNFLRSSHQGPETFRVMRRALARGGQWKGEISSRRKNGEAYSAFLTVSRVSGASGEICNYVVLFSDITPLKLQHEKLEHEAHFDPLTDLPNRLLLRDRLTQAMANCRRHGDMLAVLYLDLDGFKSINDQYGHRVGDELLIAISHHMQTALRESDTLARVGGDEFVIVLTELTAVQDCFQVVNRVIEACGQPLLINDVALSVTASVGVTLYPAGEVDGDLLVRHADQAMYKAKRAGKNRYQLYDAAEDA